MPRRSRCETESRHVIVVDPKDLLTRESDRVVIGVTALDPRGLEDVELIRRSRVLGYERFKKHVIADNAVRVRHARARREDYHQRENYFPPHKHPPRPLRAVSRTRGISRPASNRPN